MTSMYEEMTAEQFEMLLQMAVPPQPPYLLAGVGMATVSYTHLTLPTT